MDELLNELRVKLIAALKLSDIKPEEIDVDAPLIGEGLGLDSIDTLELLVLLEKEYGVTVPDVNTGRSVFASVRALAEYIVKNRN
ncbi:MAG TPA: phosphopantetheine-binding protein [Chitinispirillaceae bacterium]|nr:phosphopantetheine-binding protein [Chitinispirillaceae bacterium]